MCSGKCVTKYCPTRLAVALMVFFACFMNYMMRVNMSLIIIEMCPDKKPDETMLEDTLFKNNITFNSSNQISQRGESELSGRRTYKWSTTQQAYVLSGYFWGYTGTCLVGGFAAEYLGSRKLVFFMTMVSALMTLLCPFAARVNLGSLVAVRVLCGFGGGVLYPALHTIVAHWAPPQERGKFVSTLVGGTIGTVVTWVVAGPIIKVFGWEWAFYIPGMVAVIWCFVWLYIVYDSPIQHPRISETEKKYIVDSLGERVSHSKKSGKVVAPLKSILTSFPFLAMVLLHFGSCWGLYLVLNTGPKYVASCLKYDISAAGGLTALPYLFRMTSSLIFGSIGDRIVKKQLMSLTKLRKGFTFFSHILPGLLLLALSYSTSAVLSIALLTLALGANGAVVLTNVVNHQDLAPNFAGTLYAFANTGGNIAGFLTPIVTAEFTKHGQGFENWRPVFLVGASIYIGTAVWFILFGSTKTQKWNYYGQTPQK